MSARLPVPGEDDGVWGAILNEFLEVSHNKDGTLSQSSLTTAGVLQSSNNLADVSSAAAARGNLGLGSAATLSSAVSGDLSGTLPSPTVAKVNGVAVAGTPSNGQVLTALSATSAQWSSPSSGALQTFAATANGTIDVNAYCAPGSRNVASTAGIYTQAMVGLTAVFIQGGSGGTTDVLTTVQSVTDNNHLVLANAVPGGTGNPQTLIIGTDISTTLVSAFADAGSSNKTLYIPAGTYIKTASVTVPSNIKVVGAGRQQTVIIHASSTTSAFVGNDLSSIVFEDWTVLGPGQGIGSGSGISFTLSANPATYYPTLRRFSASKFGVDGIAIAIPIVGNFDQVVPENNGRHGFNIAGAGEADGTSCTFDACFSAGNWAAGYYLNQMAYSTLNGCAADANGVAYYYNTCIGITESGCGSEETYNFRLLGKTTFTPNGLSRYIANSKVVLNSPYMIQNVGISCYVTNGAKVVINDYYEGSPGNTDDVNSNPTASLKVDSGCKVIVNNYQNSTAMSLAGGSTTLLPDALSSAGASGGIDTLTANQNILPRYICASAVSTGASQSLRLSYFTATTSATYTQLKTVTSTTAAGATPTLCKMGLYAIDASGNGTLIAGTASDTTLWATTNTVFTRSTTASYSVTAGSRYALAVLVVTAAAVPTIVGCSMAGSTAANTVMAESPRAAGALSGQADLPASFLDSSLTGIASVFYGELVP